LDREYIQTGKVKYVILDLPLASIHPLAMKAAEATHCAGEQGKYWEMHDALFANQRQLARPDLSKHAQALGLDVAAFDQCLDKGTSAARIRKDMAEAQRLQITGTPTFIVGLTSPDSSQITGLRISGAQPYQAFKDAIERLLSSAK
jgi:protein-disulfide isomerase